MIKKEFEYFCTAIMFFTRIPIPWKLNYDEKIMNESQKYFSLVGVLVGLIVGTTLYLLQHILPIELAVLLSIGWSILLTGGFHEDGFMDVCDGFGGGYGANQILKIMTDSRVGSYAVLGMILLLSTKFFALKTLASTPYLSIITISIIAHSLSRFTASLMIYTHQYVQHQEVSKSKPLANKKIHYTNLIWSSLITLVPFLWIKSLTLLLVIPFSFFIYFFMARYFKKHIGGFTGDCLGAIQQVTEVGIYLTMIILWQYI